MANFNRSLWTTILFVALLAPLTLLLAMFRWAPFMPRSSVAASQPATQAGPSLLHPPAASAPASPTTQTAEVPLFFAAGNARAFWVVRPLYSGKAPAFQLLRRLSNSGTWSAADMDGAAYGRGFPQGLAATSLDSSATNPDAYVFAAGSLTRFSLQNHEPRACLPRDHVLLSTAASETQIVAVTVGTPPAGAQHPGDRLKPSARSGVASSSTTSPADDSPFGPDTQPAASQAATSSQPASAPAESLPTLINAYAYRTGQWIVLPPLGPARDESTAETPGVHSFVTTAAVRDRFFVMWVDPTAPGTLVARSIDTGKAGGAWSKPVTSPLEEPLQPGTRLMSAVLDQTVFVMWPEITPQEMRLRGGWLDTDRGAGDLTLPAQNFIPAISLGPPAPDETSGNIAIAPAENSLAVIFMSHDRQLVCQVFDQRGKPVAAASVIEARPAQRDAQIVQNAALVVMILVLFLSLWQWKQRPLSPTLPSDLQVTPLHLRALGFVIDLAIPLVIVSAAMGMFEMVSFTGMFTSWFAALTNPEELLNAPLLVYVLGAYVVHVTIGELFFRRSIGKAILGLQVLMIDGRAPTVAAILLRNLVRIPELLSGILIIYIFMSTQRQRLGDLFARTVVVSQKAPPTPPDPDRADEETSVGAGDSKESR
ncbi:MAG: RDD family protein [Phycisphaerae bacterium]